MDPIFTTQGYSLSTQGFEATNAHRWNLKDAEIIIAQQSNQLHTRHNDVTSINSSTYRQRTDEQQLVQSTILKQEIELSKLRMEITDSESNLKKFSVGSSQHNAQQSMTIPQGSLERLQSHLNHLHQSRNTKLHDLDALYRRLSPVYHIPPEILGEIFLYTIPPRTFIEPSADSTPLVLASVCSSWRKVAISTSALWSSIAIEVQRDTSRPHVSLISQWLKRAGIKPISFSITETGSKTRTQAKSSVIPTVLGLFIPLHEQWKNVRIKYKDSWAIGTGFSSLRDYSVFPQLESLHLDRGYWLEQQDIDHISNMMLTAPRLREVGWISQKPYTALSLPWTSLTHFTLGHVVSMKEGLEILEGFTNLENAELSMILPTTIPIPIEGLTEGTNIMVTHRTLRHLTLQTSGLLGAFFNRVTLPALKGLYLDTLGKIYSTLRLQDDLVWPQEEFASFVARSGCSITNLSIKEIPFKPHHVLSILKEVSPSLENLTLSDDFEPQGFVTDEVLQQLTFPSNIWEPSSEKLCPQLKSLTLWGCVSASAGNIGKMLKSRWNPLKGNDFPFTRLERATLGLIGASPEDMDYIRELQADRAGIYVFKL